MDGAWGWYGKLPALGDFASRRLAPAFVEPWDAWLAQGLADWRERDPGWLDAYLAGPVWCFHLGAQVLAPARGVAWVGVLMPSVDRVGRYFPLTVAAPADSEPQLTRLRYRLQHTARVAAEAMHGDWSAAEFDQALADLTDLTLPLERGDDPDLAQALQAPGAAGRSLWWPPGATPALQVHAALPRGDAFERLLGGSVPAS